MVVTPESTEEQGLSAGKGEIAAAHGDVVEADRRKKKARPMGTRTEFRGVRRQESGMYTAQIWDPSRRTQVWLGTFFTAEDATKAYDAAAFGLHAAGVAVRKKAAARPDARTEFRGVFRLLNGKYAAQIRDPSRRAQVCLGRFGTAEEAAKAYDAAAGRLYGAKAKPNFMIPPAVQSFSGVTAESAGMSEIAEGQGDTVDGIGGLAQEHGDGVEGMGEISEEHEGAVEGAGRRKVRAWPEARTKFRGILRLPSGKYRAAIWCPLRRKQVHLGTFSTADDAAEAREAAASARDSGRGLEKATGVSGFRGVCQRQSGKYVAQIWDPVQRTQVYLGTFDRAQDAANAYDAEAVRLHGARAITNLNLKQPPMDLNSGELPEHDFSLISDEQLDDVWTDLPQAELQPVDELLQDMDFTLTGMAP